MRSRTEERKFTFKGESVEAYVKILDRLPDQTKIEDILEKYNPVKRTCLFEGKEHVVHSFTKLPPVKRKTGLYDLVEILLFTKEEYKKIEGLGKPKTEPKPAVKPKGDEGK